MLQIHGANSWKQLSSSHPCFVPAIEGSNSAQAAAPSGSLSASGTLTSVEHDAQWHSSVSARLKSEKVSLT